MTSSKTRAPKRLIKGGVYKREVFILKIKIEENEIMCELKTRRYFLHHAV